MAEGCQHTFVAVIDGEHRCGDCGDPVELRTKTGKILTPTDVEDLADEAERGYDPKVFGRDRRN
jgi:hypothetical protein